MTTIHSLPPELLHAILQLAYPHTDHRSHSRPNLSRASLVHSSWRPVAQGLMTETLSFHHSNRGQLRSFAGNGPRGFTCRRLRFAGTAEDLVGLMGRAQGGGIAELVLEAGLSERLFGLPGLNGVRSLRFETDFSPTEMNPDATAHWSWSTTLRHLSIDKATYPVELLTASASTLTSLELRWTSPDQLPTVLAAAPLLTSLRTLSIHEAFGPLAGTPQAKLDSIYPAQLADILNALTTPPATLSTSILTAEVEELDEPRTYDPTQAAEFIATLVRCAHSPGLRGVREWRFRVLDDGDGWLEDLTARQMDSLFGADGFQQSQGWEVFKTEMARRGVRLVCGPGPGA